MSGARLRQVRESTGLDPERFARLAGVDPHRLARWEASASEPTPEETDAVARVVGVRIADLDQAGGWPLQPFLFRAAGQPGLHALEQSRTFGTLGDALRTAADVRELEQVLGIQPRVLPSLKPPSTRSIPVSARELAVAARARIGLAPADPIPSMREVATRLGIRVLFVHSDKLAVAFQAASAISPRPMILVSLIHGRDAFWQVRMAIAHELGHLLFDHGRESVNVSAPTIADTVSLSDDYSVVESRADAFAAVFLAPHTAVRDAVGDHSPSSGLAIKEVARRFGIGFTTAVNRLTDVYELTESTRHAMLRRDVYWERGSQPDVVREEDIGFAPPWLCELVGRALTAKAIDRMRAYEILGLALNEELPVATGLEPQLRRPLRR